MPGFLHFDSNENRLKRRGDLVIRWTLGFVLTLSVSVAEAFSLVTYNVAEFSDAGPQRLEALIEGILALEPDILLLQEAGKETVKVVERATKARNAYQILRDGSLLAPPSGGLMILMKRGTHSHRVRFQRLPSDLDRGALLVNMDLCGVDHTLINVHLESPDLLFYSRSLELRREQAAAVSRLTESAENLLVAGDMNIVSDNDADTVFPENWVDVWSSKHSGDLGPTWDPKTNEMASFHGLLRISGFRVDRLLFKSSMLDLKSSERLGLNDRPPLSDHYGLRVEFACRK